MKARLLQRQGVCKIGRIYMYVRFERHESEPQAIKVGVAKRR